jgi:DNA-binding GntR family transcriptional regulator
MRGSRAGDEEVPRTLTKLVAATPNEEANATLTARMHSALETAIINGTLPPGQRIHPDVLAAEYGMSRIPVREALRSLHEAGWVDIRPRHGVFVRERTAEELDELFEFRALVEARVARWAAQRRTESEVEVLRAIVAAGSARATADNLAITNSFYDGLRAAAHNSVLAATSSDLEKRAKFYFSTVVDELGDDWRHVHEELFDLVASKQAAAASRLAQQHIEDTGAAVRVLLFEHGAGRVKAN